PEPAHVEAIAPAEPIREEPPAAAASAPFGDLNGSGHLAAPHLINTAGEQILGDVSTADCPRQLRDEFFPVTRSGAHTQASELLPDHYGVANKSLEDLTSRSRLGADRSANLHA